jgi:hypothetical protein
MIGEPMDIAFAMLACLRESLRMGRRLTAARHATRITDE